MMTFSMNKDADSNQIKKITPVLNLPTLDSVSLDPFAKVTYSRFIVELFEVAPKLKELSEKDRNSFLSEDEKGLFLKCESDGIEWLKKCALGNDKYMSFISCISPPSMRDLRILIKKIADRKSAYLTKIAEEESARLKQEELKREQEELKKKRSNALMQMNIDFDDVEKYLDSVELISFRKNAVGAADAFLDGGKGCPGDDWRYDPRATIFCNLLYRIQQRKQAEAQRIQAKRDEEVQQRRAEVECADYQKQIKTTIQKLKADLAKMKKPEFYYPAIFNGYVPQSWCESEKPEGVEDWVRPIILEKLPKELKELVSWELRWEWTDVPYCTYFLDGLPSLLWRFNRNILVTVILKIKDANLTKIFQGYRYSIPINTEEMGNLYVGPEQWEEPESFTTPLILLAMLARGKMETSGVKVMDVDKPWITYKIEGFSDEVILHDDFRHFIQDIVKNISLDEALLKREMCDEDTAKLIKENLEKIQQPHETTAVFTNSEQEDEAVVVAALVKLNYQQSEAKKVAEHICKKYSGDTTENKLNYALQYLDNNKQ